jgi:hypothetical protein
MSEPIQTSMVDALNAAIAVLNAVAAQATQLNAAADAFRLSPKLNGDLDTAGFDLFATSEDEGEAAITLRADRIQLHAESETVVSRGVYPNMQPLAFSGTALTLSPEYDGRVVRLMGAAPCTVTIADDFTGSVVFLNPALRTHELVAPEGALIDGEESIAFSGKRIAVLMVNPAVAETY